MALSTVEIKLVNLVNSRQEAKSRQFGKGNYGPPLNPEEWRVLNKFYSQEENFPYINKHEIYTGYRNLLKYDSAGPLTPDQAKEILRITQRHPEGWALSCNLFLVRQMQGEEGKPETKHAPVITSRGKQTPRFSLKCKYRDGNEFTLPGNKYGWEPDFQLKTLLKYVDSHWHRIKHCQLFDNSRTAPNNWLYKWNCLSGEVQENDGWNEPSKFHRYPTGLETLALKPDEKHRIFKKYNAWFQMNQTPIITLNPDVTGSQKQTA